MKRKIVLVSLAFLMIAMMCMPVSAWAGRAHQDTVRVAGDGILGPAALANAVAGSIAPDFEPYMPLDWLNHGYPLIAGRTNTVANQARAELHSGTPGTGWATTYGVATHYMTDASMPYHTDYFFNSVTFNGEHNSYESHVESEWSHFRRIMRGAPVNYISNVQTTTDNMVYMSHSSGELLHTQISTNPNWENSIEVQNAIDNLLYTATANNRGMLGYVQRAA
jgi:hypothetical protein